MQELTELQEYKEGHTFSFKTGDRVICYGFPGLVSKVLSGKHFGFVEVRLVHHTVKVPATFPNCYPPTRSAE